MKAWWRRRFGRWWWITVGKRGTYQAVVGPMTYRRAQRWLSDIPRADDPAVRYPTVPSALLFVGLPVQVRWRKDRAYPHRAGLWPEEWT